MNTQWKPSVQLVESLNSSGVDKGLLQDLLEEVETASLAGALVTPKVFVLEAIERQTSFANSLNDDVAELEGIPPSTYMKRSWRPKEETIQIIIEAYGDPEFDRIALGYLREEFKKIEGQAQRVHRYWDFAFTKFALQKLTEKQQSRAKNAVYSEPQAPRVFSEDEIASNLIRVNTLVGSLLNDISVGRDLNRRLDGKWQPHNWVKVKLLKRGIPKKFIFDDIRRLSFVYWANSQNAVKLDCNSLYYQKVLTDWNSYSKEILKVKRIIKEAQYYSDQGYDIDEEELQKYLKSHGL